MTDTDPTGLPNRPRRRWRRAAFLGIAAAGIGVAAVAAWYHAHPAATLLPVPDPNGYDDLLRAARAISGTPPKHGPQFGQITRQSAGEAAFRLDPMASTWDEARAYLDANRDVLARARGGLDRDCVVPVSFEIGYDPNHNTTRADLDKLARVFLWEAHLAVREDRPAEAARSFLDLVRLGHASARGGFEITFWGPGHPIESGGLIGLSRIVGELDPATCRRAIAVIGDLDRRREPYRALRARTEARNDALQGRFQTTLFELANYRRLAEERRWLDESYDESIVLARLVEVELALRAFRVEEGRDPDDLRELIPSYLPDLPLDPFSGRPPAYRKGKSGPVIYSIGPDRIDDGGAPLVRPNPRARPTGDIVPGSTHSPLAP